MYTPFSITRTRWIFGRNLRRLARMEKLRVLPNSGFLPHRSQTAMAVKPSKQLISEDGVYRIMAQQRKQGGGFHEGYREEL